MVAPLYLLQYIKLHVLTPHPASDSSNAGDYLFKLCFL